MVPEWNSSTSTEIETKMRDRSTELYRLATTDQESYLSLEFLVGSKNLLEMTCSCAILRHSLGFSGSGAQLSSKHADSSACF